MMLAKVTQYNGMGCVFILLSASIVLLLVFMLLVPFEIVGELLKINLIPYYSPLHYFICFALSYKSNIENNVLPYKTYFNRSNF